jgi:RimJ/RimL family protein N-acetyltransferase
MEVTLETPRLLLRAFRGGDLEAYAAMSADPEVMRYIGAGASLDRNESWRSISGMLGHWQLLGYGMWALEEKATGALVGRGYATEAARVTLVYEALRP